MRLKKKKKLPQLNLKKQEAHLVMEHHSEDQLSAEERLVEDQKVTLLVETSLLDWTTLIILKRILPLKKLHLLRRLKPKVKVQLNQLSEEE